MKIDALKVRVDQLEDQLSGHLVDVEILQNKLGLASGSDYIKVVEDLAVARMKTEVMQEALDKARSDVAAEEAEMKSPEYKSAWRKMASLKSDADKLADEVASHYDDFRSALEKMTSVCGDYDRLARQYQDQDPNKWMMSSYRWPSYLQIKMSRIARRP